MTLMKDGRREKDSKPQGHLIMETKPKAESTAKNDKKGMGAFRLPQEILDNVKEISSETGIPTSSIVTKCLAPEKVVEVVREQLEGALNKFTNLSK